MKYQPYIPATFGELWDKLGSMTLNAPRFTDDSGYFPDMSIETEFFALNESLALLRKQLGEDRYRAMRALSDRMRAHFEADPEDMTDDGIAGRALIGEMEALLKASRRPR